jgi:hypothetical protein
MLVARGKKKKPTIAGLATSQCVADPTQPVGHEGDAERPPEATGEVHAQLGPEPEAVPELVPRVDCMSELELPGRTSTPSMCVERPYRAESTDTMMI